MKMSPAPWSFRHVEVSRPPGMTQTTAPGVTVAGHATLLPVLGSTQWPSFPRSPLGAVPAGGFALGRPLATGMDSKSGAGAPALSRDAPGLSDQPFKVPPLTVIP